MVATYAQKQASERYRKKREALGFKQRLIYADALHWQVLSPLYKWINGLDFSNLESVELDDNGEFVKFIYNDSGKSDDTETKAVEDGKR